jgi:hypothetical protein
MEVALRMIEPGLAGGVRRGEPDGPPSFLAFNAGGQPAIPIPCGFDDDGMPIGLQLAGRPFDDGTVLRAAHAYQQATDWQLRRPSIAASGATRDPALRPTERGPSVSSDVAACRGP